VFQSKRREKLPAALGDVDLKTFVGSLAQLNKSFEKDKFTGRAKPFGLQ
jgi:hypothetical protein